MGVRHCLVCDRREMVNERDLLRNWATIECCEEETHLHCLQKLLKEKGVDSAPVVFPCSNCGSDPCQILVDSRHIEVRKPGEPSGVLAFLWKNAQKILPSTQGRRVSISPVAAPAPRQPAQTQPVTGGRNLNTSQNNRSTNRQVHGPVSSHESLYRGRTPPLPEDADRTKPKARRSDLDRVAKAINVGHRRELERIERDHDVTNEILKRVKKPAKTLPTLDEVLNVDYRTVYRGPPPKGKLYQYPNPHLHQYIIDKIRELRERETAAGIPLPPSSVGQQTDNGHLTTAQGIPLPLSIAGQRTAGSDLETIRSEIGTRHSASNNIPPPLSQTMRVPVPTYDPGSFVGPTPARINPVEIAREASRPFAQQWGNRGNALGLEGQDLYGTIYEGQQEDPTPQVQAQNGPEGAAGQPAQDNVGAEENQEEDLEEYAALFSEPSLPGSLDQNRFLEREKNSNQENDLNIRRIRSRRLEREFPVSESLIIEVEVRARSNEADDLRPFGPRYQFPTRNRGTQQDASPPVDNGFVTTITSFGLFQVERFLLELLRFATVPSFGEAIFVFLIANYFLTVDQFFTSLTIEGLWFLVFAILILAVFLKIGFGTSWYDPRLRHAPGGVAEEPTALGLYLRLFLLIFLWELLKALVIYYALEGSSGPPSPSTTYESQSG